MSQLCLCNYTIRFDITLNFIPEFPLNVVVNKTQCFALLLWFSSRCTCNFPCNFCSLIIFNFMEGQGWWSETCLGCTLTPQLMTIILNPFSNCSVSSQFIMKSSNVINVWFLLKKWYKSIFRQSIKMWIFCDDLIAFMIGSTHCIQLFTSFIDFNMEKI